MSTTRFSKNFVRSLAILALASIYSVSCAQDQSSSASTKATSSKQQVTGAGESEVSDRLKEEVARKVARKAAPRRLPRYFASVVDQLQRERIYKIQSSYRLKIEEVELQLEQLRSAQMKEIEQVLTANQLQRVQELRSQARSFANTQPPSGAGLR